MTPVTPPTGPQPVDTDTEPREVLAEHQHRTVCEPHLNPWSGELSDGHRQSHYDDIERRFTGPLREAGLVIAAERQVGAASAASGGLDVERLARALCWDVHGVGPCVAMDDHRWRAEGIAAKYSGSVRFERASGGLDIDELGFYDLLDVADAILRHYPPDTIVCSHSVKADPGARTTAAIADLIASCRATLQPGESE